MLIQIATEGRVKGVKKHVSTLPLETILRVAKDAGQSAAANAVAAGRRVAGLKNGKVVEYGPGALPLSQKSREKGKRDAILA